MLWNMEYRHGGKEDKELQVKNKSKLIKDKDEDNFKINIDVNTEEKEGVSSLEHLDLDTEDVTQKNASFITTVIMIRL
jgi:hypothetical protein